MKKIFLSTILLLSCAAKAGDTITDITPESIKPENVTSETISPENVVATPAAPQIIAAEPEMTKSEEAITKKETEVNVAEIIQANMDGVTENCDTILLNFRISRKKDKHNKQAWMEIIKATVTLIAAAQMSNANKEQGQKIEEINKILNQSYEFLANTTKLTGEANGIYGGYGIHLDIPKEYAQTIFPSENK